MEISQDFDGLTVLTGSELRERLEDEKTTIDEISAIAAISDEQCRAADELGDRSEGNDYQLTTGFAVGVLVRRGEIKLATELHSKYTR